MSDDIDNVVNMSDYLDDINEKYIVSGDAYGGSEEVMFHLPEYSEWSCYLLENTIFTPVKDDVPNRFHRWMQELCFGVKWRKSGD